MKSLAALMLSFFCTTAFGMTLPDTTVPNSCGVQIKGNCSSAEDFARMREVGLTWVRRGFHWEGIEKEIGVYDFSSLDVIVADAEAAGLSVLGCLAFNNKLYPKVMDADPAGREAYAHYAAACAKHYAGRNVIWELWNEPNVRTFWGHHGMHNTPQYALEYTALVKLAAPAMKAANPDCVVVAGAVSCLGWDVVDVWQDACFAAGMCDTGIDAWSAHPYSLKRPEDYGEAYGRARALMAKHGKVLPILNSERGYPISKKAEGWSGGEGDLYQFQAWHCTRQYLNDLMNDVRMTSWYEWLGAGKEEGFSLYNPERELPLHQALTVLLRELNGMQYQERFTLESGEDYVLLFTGPNGARCLAAWTAPAKGKAPHEAKPHEVTFAVTGNGSATSVDLMGTKSEVTITNGRMTLHLSGGPQYVHLPLLAK